MSSDRSQDIKDDESIRGWYGPPAPPDWDGNYRSAWLDGYKQAAKDGGGKPWNIVIFGGSRTWTDVEVVHAIMLGTYAVIKEDMLLMHGGAPGLDRIADRIAKQNGVPVVEVPALWDFYGNAAGPKRNRWMLRFRPFSVFLFLNERTRSPGTKDMIQACENVGIKPAIIR